MDINYAKLESFFADNGYVWKFTDGHRSPTADELKTTLDKMTSALLESGTEASQIEVGRLLLKRDNEGLLLYVHWSD